MLDIRWIRENPEAFDKGLARRGMAPLSAQILRLDKQWREAQTAAEQNQAARGKLGQEMAAAKAKGGDAAALMRQMTESKEKQAFLEAEATRLREAVDAALAPLPNLPADDVPDGKDVVDNKLLREVGAKPKLAFKPKDHAALGEALGGLDFARAAKMSGARFVVLSGGLARLARALGQFMLDLHTREFGYTEVAPPLLVRDAAAFGTGQLPKFADDLFRTTAGLWLVPTAEVPLTNLAREDIVDEAALPLRYVAHTPCFRSEAGAAGKDTRGMIRQHQFDKVELVQIVEPERSYAALEELTGHAEAVLKALELPYRVMALCAGDVGFSSAKTYDLEVWLPSQGRYREISSCSNCEAFQARRLQARWRNPTTGKPEPVHTLNGSGVAVGRALVAILENGQQEDGSVVIPGALARYMGGIERLR